MAAAALVDAPNIDWTEDDGLYREWNYSEEMWRT